MTDDVTTEVLAALTRVAPEIDPATVDPTTPLTDQLDLDSIDYLRFLTDVSARFQVDIPDTVAQKLYTVDDVAGYVRAHRGDASRAGA